MPMSIEELNEEYNRSLIEKMKIESTISSPIISQKSSIHKKKTISKSQTMITDKQLQKQKNNSKSILTFIQTNLKIIIFIIICASILLILPLIIFYLFIYSNSGIGII